MATCNIVYLKCQANVSIQYEAIMVCVSVVLTRKSQQLRRVIFLVNSCPTISLKHARVSIFLSPKRENYLVNVVEEVWAAWDELV